MKELGNSKLALYPMCENGHGQSVVSGGFAKTEVGWAGSPAGVEQNLMRIILPV